MNLDRDPLDTLIELSETHPEEWTIQDERWGHKSGVIFNMKYFPGLSIFSNVYVPVSWRGSAKLWRAYNRWLNRHLLKNP